MRLYFIMLILFAAATLFFGEYPWQLAAAEGVIVVLLFVYSRIAGRRRSRDMLKYIESVTSNLDSATKNTLQNFPLPMVIFGLEESEIIYANEGFLAITGEREHVFSINISEIVPGFSARWLMEGKNEYPDLVAIGDRKFRVFGSLVRGSNAPGIKNFVATTYWIDETEYSQIKDEFSKSRLIFSIIMLDNYDEFINGLSEKDKSALVSQIDDKITSWSNHRGGYITRIERDRYVFLFEERYLQGYVDEKFSILDSVRELSTPKGMHPTVSIGIGKDGKNISENFQYASLGLEMALSRGGDQAVIKNRYNFEFYGGKTSQTEKRTKVKSRVMASSLSELMRDASSIFIMGHKFADLDSVGSAVGLCCAARSLKKHAQIVIEMDTQVSTPLIDRMLTLPEYQEVFISPQDALLAADGSSLLIVVDTNRPEQVESESLLQSCNRVAVIDHHRRAATYIQNAALSFHEPYASSASELVTELLQYMVEQSDILRFEAEALLAGIVLDTKNFTLRTGGRTFDAAAFLRRAGADTTEVKHLLQSDLKSAVARYSIVQKAKIYKAGIAIAAPETAENKIIAAQAADELLNISGIQASFVVFPLQGVINISARSLGDINVQLIVEKLGGGGNKSTAGAQISGKTQKEVVHDLLIAIDKYLDDNSMAGQ
ncbi:MAG: DHH family phosphoesterase [Oscillospiraceae bacterium]